MPRTHDLGILFVHGIGQQRRGMTLIRFGEPLSQAVRDRFSGGVPSDETLPSERLGTVQLGTAFLDDPQTPPHVEIKLRNIQSFRAKPSANPDADWLLAEAWWADVFPIPPFSELFRWTFDIVPWTLITHFDTRVRRALFRLREAATWEEFAFAAAGTAWKAVVFVLVSLVAIPILVFLLLAILLVAVSPIPYARNAAAWLQRQLAATIGDSYAFVGWPIAGAAIIGRVARDFTWLQERCERVVIVAHSQGAAITHEFLRNAPLTPCDAFVTIGSGVRKLSEIRDAYDSKAQLWLRLMGAAGLVADGLLITLISAWIRGVVPDRLPWLLGGLVLMAVVMRLAFVQWRKKSKRSINIEEQRSFDRQRYNRRYRLPARFQWMDCFAALDPVSNGRLLDILEPLEMRTRQVDNYHSMLFDHTTYWRNKDDFVAQLSCELMRKTGIDCERIDKDDVPRQQAATARRHLRVGSLRASRWVVLAASLVAILAWWDNAPDGALAAISAALRRIPFVGNELAQIPHLVGNELAQIPHLTGILLIVIAAAIWSVVLRLIWNSWNARDTERRYRREDFRPDPRAVLFLVLFILGLALVLLATWLTGDARAPMVVTAGLAVVSAILILTETTHRTEIVTALRAMSADGPVADAAKGLRDVELKRLERGVKLNRGWAAFKLGELVMDADPLKGVEYWERALALGFSKAALHLGLHFENQDEKAALKNFKTGMDKGDPDCARFMGALQEKRGELKEARATFSFGLDRLQSPECGHLLGRLLLRIDPKAPPAVYEPIYEKGIKLGDAGSAMDLAELLRQRAYQHPSVSPAEQRRLLVESEANFRKALQFGEIEAATRLGEVLLEKGDIVGARKAFTDGMELRKPRAAFKLGELAIQEQDHDLAQRAFERCVELADEAHDERMVVEASYRLGRLFETIGRHAAAEHSYLRALGSDGGVGFPPAAMRLAEIVQAAGGDPASAKDQIGALYRRGIELGSAEAALKLGQLDAQHS